MFLLPGIATETEDIGDGKQTGNMIGLAALLGHDFFDELAIGGDTNSCLNEVRIDYSPAEFDQGEVIKCRKQEAGFIRIACLDLDRFDCARTRR